MISLLGILALMVSLLGQERTAPVNLPDRQLLTPAEKSLLERETDIDGRIRIYESASLRFQRSIQVDTKQEEIEGFLENLESWVKLLSASLEDIENNANRKKKSRALIRYEIQVRKTAGDLQDARPTIPLESQAEFDSYLGRAEVVRKTFVDILFQR
jgi:hypothetical protein